MSPEGSPDWQDASRLRLEEGAALPLRLSVAEGGLGLELSKPVHLGLFTVAELEVGLIGLRYPVDLSRGVKHFRNRRSALRRAVVHVDLALLSEQWSRVAEEVLGGPAKVRIRPTFEDVGDSGLRQKLSENLGGAARTDALAVTAYTSDAALCFDLVLASGSSPRFIVDAPRLYGRDDSALLLAFRMLDAGLSVVSGGSAVSGRSAGLRRSGRALEIQSLARSVALMVLPVLGCRLPEVSEQVIFGVEASRGVLSLSLGRREEPFRSGRRALRCSATASFVRDADALLASGDLDGARARYLGALEQVPEHPEILSDLAELDLSLGGRAESALAFLTEQEGPALSHGPEATSRHHLAFARALALSGRKDAALESLRRAVAAEPDPILRSLSLMGLSRGETDPEARRKDLDSAVKSAPFFQTPRVARFHLALQMGDLRTAGTDAEQWEAMESAPDSRSRICLGIGEVYLEHGYEQRALVWFKRSLRYCPASPEIMIALACCLNLSGEPLRAGELFQTALLRLEELEPGGIPGEKREAVPLPQLQGDAYFSLMSKANFHLGKILGTEMNEASSGLAHLSRVDSRSEQGAEARVLEAELHQGAARLEERDRALSRLFEAAELGWLKVAPFSRRIALLLEAVEKQGDQAVAEWGRRLLSALEER